jgi:hypothetical protein
MATPTSEINDPKFTNFLTTVARFGLSKPYKFKILDISPLPAGLNFPGGFQSGALLLFTSLALPSRRINTTTVPYKAFEFLVPTNASFPENQNWPINVLQDENLLLRDFFEKWSEKMYDIQNNAQQFVNTNLEFAVYEDVSDPNANKTPGIGQPIQSNSATSSTVQVIKRKYTLHGVYPVLIGGVQYSFTDSGSNFASFNVSFAYQYFTAEDPAIIGTGSTTPASPALPTPGSTGAPQPSQRKSRSLRNITNG